MHLFNIFLMTFQGTVHHGDGADVVPVSLPLLHGALQKGCQCNKIFFCEKTVSIHHSVRPFMCPSICPPIALFLLHGALKEGWQL